MLESVKISRRQSEIRQQLTGLAAKATPSEDEVRSMDELDSEYRTNETRYRAALISEDTERREAGNELETRSEREWADLMGRFEMRQVAYALDEGRSLSGQTAEVVTELRNAGGYRGIPVPWEALEIRAGETVAANTPNPIRTAPIIERLFANSVATSMGVQMVNVGVGEMEYPVATSGVVAAWANGEGGNVAGAVPYETVDRPLKPDHSLGIQMKLTRKTLKQAGAGLEQAVRRDMNGAIQEALDKAVFLGAGANGEPLGIVTGAEQYGITATDVEAEAAYQTFLTEIVAFMTGNAIKSPEEVKTLMRPELFGALEGKLNDITQTTEYYRLACLLSGRVPTGYFPGNIFTSANALAQPVGSPLATTMVMTTSAGGVPPVFVGTWGAVDLIRDPYSDAQNGSLRLTALTTMDVTVSRSDQTRILNKIHLAAA